MGTGSRPGGGPTGKGGTAAAATPGEESAIDGEQVSSTESVALGPAEVLLLLLPASAMIWTGCSQSMRLEPAELPVMEAGLGIGVPCGDADAAAAAAGL